jgi:hypothetical protein
LTDKVNNDLDIINAWFLANRIKLNTKKTLCICFGSPSDRAYLASNVRLESQLLNFTDTIKILGVHIDSRLTWSDHLSNEVNKLSAANAMLFRLRIEGYPQHVLLAVYSALFLPYVHCCASLWGFTVKRAMKQLQIQMNKGLRTIHGLGYRESVRDLMQSKRLLNVRQICDIGSLKFIYANTISRFPIPCLSEILHSSPTGFSLHMETRSRSRSALFVPAFNTERRRRSVFIRGVVLFNDLPMNIKAFSSLNAFKSRILRSYFPA